MSTTPNEQDVYVVVNGSIDMMLDFKVIRGDSVYSLKKKIKEEGKIIFASLDAVEIQLFKTTELNGNFFTKGDPLHPIKDVWNIGVVWGTIDVPLFVDLPPPTTNNNNGECASVVWFLLLLYFFIDYFDDDY